MDINRFKELKTGKLVPIKTPMGPDHAFVPDSLPPNWQLPNHLHQKLVEARAALAELNGIGKTLPHPELLLSPLRRQEAIASSRIEGAYATAQEVMLFEMAPPPPDSKASHDQTAPWVEVANYSLALAKGNQLLDEFPYCGRVVKELHEILMRGVRGQHFRRGEWRDHQVAIGSDRRYVPPPKPQMEQCLVDLEKYVNSSDAKKYDPLVRAYLVHYQFEAIHPFSDGNGRIGRVLLSLLTKQWCKLSMPWLYMSPFFEKYKDEYVDNLFKVSADGAWDKWIDFCLTGTILQANDAKQRCEKLGKLKDDMIEKSRPEGSPRTEQIIEMLFSNPIVRVSNLKRTLEVSYPTAQSDVDRLVKNKILFLFPDMRPKTYFSPEIMDIAYREVDYINAPDDQISLF